MKRVYLAYRATHRKMGGKKMRCDQLAELCRQFLSGRYDVQTVAIPKTNRSKVLEDIKGPHCAVVGLKGALTVLEKSELEELSEGTAFLGVDYLDMTIRRLLAPEIIKLHIGASISGTRSLKKFADDERLNEQVCVHHLPHHADPRLAPTPIPMNVLRIGYFGDLHNAILTDTIKKRVVLPSTDITRDFAKLVRNMQLCGLHYAVRPDHSQSHLHKPFTKGFNAAACHANILVNRTADDAVHYLGTDYPYLVNDTSEGAVIAALEYAQSTFGTGIWTDALDVMAGLRTASSGRRVAQRFGGIMDEAFERYAS